MAQTPGGDSSEPLDMGSPRGAVEGSGFEQEWSIPDADRAGLEGTRPEERPSSGSEVDR